MTYARKPLPLTAIRAFVASGRLWLCELMAWLAAVLGIERQVRRELIADLNELHRAVAILVYAEVRDSLVLTDGPRRPQRPGGPPPGFSRARESSAMRALWRSVRRGVGIRDRIAALAAAIDNIAAAAVRLYKRSCAPSPPP